MRYKLTFVLLLFLCALPVSAANVFVASAAAGGNTGADCANARTLTSLAAGDWVPDIVIHLCGTFTGATSTTLLTAQGSGTSGHPITVQLEVGANLTSPAWAATGAINLSNRSWITVLGAGPACGYVSRVDTPCSTTIQNTGNGTTLGQLRSSSVGVYLGDGNSGSICANCRVSNINIINIYVHTSVSDVFPDQRLEDAVEFVGNTVGLRIDHLYIHDAGWALNGWGSYEIDHNDIFNMDHGTASGANANVTINVHDNHFHDMAAWDTTSNSYHHDGTHNWNTDPFTTSGAIHNNLFDGDQGNNTTTEGIFMENKQANVDIYNNIFVVFPNRAEPGLLNIGNYSCDHVRILNNTFVDRPPENQAAGIDMQHCTNLTWENNIYTGFNTFIWINNNSSVLLADYNLYENQQPGGGSFKFELQNSPGTTNTDDINVWKAAAGISPNESHSNYFASNDINADGTLQVSSHAINACTNLTSLGISALNLDINGNARPGGVTPWNCGAIMSGGAPPPPATPSGVNIIWF